MIGHNVVLYTRDGCHFCDEAKEVLVRYGIEPQEVDIDKDPRPVEQFGECVPVVTINGAVRFRGRINEFLLRRFLRGR